MFNGSQTTKKPDLVVHIGTHKTGSTAIQNQLTAQAHKLRKSGIFYIPHPSGHKSIKNATSAHPEAVQRFTGWLEAAMRAEQIQRAGDRVLLSWEGFSGSLAAGYTNAGAVAANLRTALAPFKLKTTILVYLRRQDSFAESVYSQKVHEGLELSFADFLESLPDESFDWMNLINAYASQFGSENLIPVIYEPARFQAADDLLNDFYSRVGFRYGNAASGSERVNQRYSVPALEALRLCNQNLDGAEQHTVRRVLKKFSSEDDRTAYSLWPAGLRPTFMDRFNESNRELAQTFPNIGNGLVFEESCQDRGNTARMPEPDAVVATLANAFMKELARQGDQRRGRFRRIARNLLATARTGK